jgi:hypothetical protein
MNVGRTGRPDWLAIMEKLLKAYGKAVEARVTWERVGRWGDGNLEAAQKVERAAYRAVVKAMKAGV